jgi:putative membrane protein
MWLLNAAIFFVLFAFALNNQDSVSVKLFFGHSWDAPLVLVLLLALLAGVFLGAHAGSASASARPASAPTPP